MFLARLKPDPAFKIASDGSTIDLKALDKDASPMLASLPVVATGDVDWSKYTTETDQLSLSACAGNATGDSVEFLNAVSEEQTALAEGRAPAPTVQISRLFVYNSARQETGELGQDEGTYIRICFDVLSRFGVCREDVWPYDVSKVFTSPSLKAQREATGHKIHDYYRIKETGDAKCDAVVTALRAKHPVVFGTQITTAFMQLTDSTPVRLPTSNQTFAGGHAMMIVGYIAGLGFIVKNSWSRAWGANGLCILSPEYIAWDQTADLWVPTLGTEWYEAA
jgi:C1A family cysteine protease